MAVPGLDRMNRAREHFDRLASSYDGYKARQSYYYGNLIKLLSQLSGGLDKGAVLDLGCGTGQVVKRLKPSHGLGVDLSDGMVKIAGAGAGENLNFLAADIITFRPDRSFDLVICSDVLEHMEDYRPLLKNLSGYPGQPRIILTWPNPRWFLIMRILEFLKLKMPEGKLYPNYLEQVSAFARQAGFAISGRGYALLLPSRVFGLGDLINRLHQKGFLQRWGLIQYLVLNKE
jgi:SAM-dependent methyltransferase